MRRGKSARVHVARTILLVAFVAAWALASGRLIDPYFVSDPLTVGEKFYDLAASGRLFYHAAVTVEEALAGFVLGAATGMGAGLLLGQSRALGDILEPFIMVLYSLPKIALAPLFILWFGIDLKMKVILTAAVVFFLVFLNTYSGVRAVSREQITILRLMGAKPRHILTKVVIPSAFTWVFAGLRLSVPYALIGAIVAEIIAANRGLGFLLQDAAGQFDSGGVFAVLLAIVVLAQLLNAAVDLLERVAMPWREADHQREVTI